MIPNWTKNFKTKEEAIVRIFSDLIENPGIADKEGVCAITWQDRLYQLTPKKRKKE